MEQVLRRLRSRIGALTQTLTKSFLDSNAARKHVEKLISEYQAKGYVETAIAS